MRRKLFNSRVRLTLIFMALAASFQWSCVEIEEPRATRDNRPVVRSSPEKTPAGRKRIDLSPGRRNAVEDIRIREN